MSKKTNKDFNLDEFVERFDKFISDFYTLPAETQKPKWTMEKLVVLKQLLADINGIITSETEKAFIRKLLTDRRITKEMAKATLKKHEVRTPYDNGYDIVIDSDPRIVAEIKCNIPVKGNQFGAAQAHALKNDIKNLFYPERKLKKQGSLQGEFCKFMVVLRIGSGFDEAISKIIKDSEKDGIKIQFYQPGITIEPEPVYVMIVDTFVGNHNNLDFDGQ